MTKDEAVTEEVKTEPKTETPSPDTPTKEGDTSSTKPASESEAAGTSEGANSEGEGKETKEAGDKKDGDFKSSKKRKWFIWSKKGEQGGAEAPAGQQGEGNPNVSEDKEAPIEKELSEADMEADLQRQVKDLEAEKERLAVRINIYKLFDSLEADVADMKLELASIINKHKSRRSKSESEGTSPAKSSAQ